MADYIHHVPGRLRVRSKAFRRAGTLRNQALRELRVLSGVTSVRLNEKAASVTISYDQATTEHHPIIALLAAHKCVNASEKPVKAGTANQVKVQKSDWNIGREVGKIAFTAIVSKGVNYSLSSLLKV